MTAGRLILERGAIPSADEYSFTRSGAPYVAHEWLAQELGDDRRATETFSRLLEISPDSSYARQMLEEIRERRRRVR